MLIWGSIHAYARSSLKETIPWEWCPTSKMPSWSLPLLPGTAINCLNVTVINFNRSIQNTEVLDTFAWAFEDINPLIEEMSWRLRDRKSFRKKDWSKSQLKCSRSLRCSARSAKETQMRTTAERDWGESSVNPDLWYHACEYPRGYRRIYGLRN